MNTKQAFKKLINSQELCEKLKSEPATIRKWRQRFNEGVLPIEKQEKLLKKAGAKKIPENWEFKTK